MKIKLFLLLAVLAATFAVNSCKKDDAASDPKLTTTLTLPSTCPSNDSVEIRLFEAGKSTILAEKHGVNGKAVDFGKVNPGNYFFVGYSVQNGSVCDHWGGTGTTYSSTNFIVTEGESKHVSFP